MGQITQIHGTSHSSGVGIRRARLETRDSKRQSKFNRQCRNPAGPPKFSKRGGENSIIVPNWIGLGSMELDWSQQRWSLLLGPTYRCCERGCLLALDLHSQRILHTSGKLRGGWGLGIGEWMQTIPIGSHCWSRGTSYRTKQRG